MGATGTIPGATTGARQDGNGVDGGRVVQPRRGLPNSRAVVGGLLVALAALGIFVAWHSAAGGPSTAYAVAGRDIRPGERLTAADVVLRAADLPGSVARAAYRDAAPLDGAVALGPISAGDLVERSQVVERDAGRAGTPPAHELSFPVPADRALDGRLRIGERVAVLATFGTGQGSSTDVVTRNALVLAVDDAAGGIEGDAVVLTLAVEATDEVVALAHATRAGEVTIVRATGTAEPLD